MTKFRTTAFIAALCAGTGAMADVTAEQVWNDWQDNFSGDGSASLTTSSEDIGNGVVTISDMKLTMTDSNEDFSADLGTVVFTEQGDGTVSVQMDDSYLVDIKSSDSESAVIEVSQSGLTMIVSGTDTDMKYDISADRYGFKFLELTEGGEALLDGDLLFTLNNLSGSFGNIVGDLEDLAYDFNIGSIDLLADIKEPGGDGTVLVSGKIDQVMSASTATIPLDIENVEDPFAVGFAFVTNSSFDAANFIFDVDAEGSKAVGSIAMGAAETNLSMKREQMTYKIDFADVAVGIESNEMPLPVSISFANIGTSMDMPLSVTETPEDFAMTIKMADLTVNDEIWAMGDPTAVLPRDPITIDLDIAGKTKLFFDILDPAQQGALDRGDAPGELHALSINNLLVSAAGAKITGTGAFTFDNTDLSSFDGIPRPLGKATFGATGANALIDNLVSMGLVPADQASMGRMMMGMFARVTGDDQLETTVEVNEQGHLIVNGQRMQ